MTTTGVSVSPSTTSLLTCRSVRSDATSRGHTADSSTSSCRFVETFHYSPEDCSGIVANIRSASPGAASVANSSVIPADLKHRRHEASFEVTGRNLFGDSFLASLPHCRHATAGMQSLRPSGNRFDPESDSTGRISAGQPIRSATTPARTNGNDRSRSTVFG